jgi:hypothetical protein
VFNFLYININIKRLVTIKTFGEKNEMIDYLCLLILVTEMDMLNACSATSPSQLRAHEVHIELKASSILAQPQLHQQGCTSTQHQLPSLHLLQDKSLIITLSLSLSRVNSIFKI